MCMCVGHPGELCIERLADGDAIWDAELCGPKEPWILDGVPDSHKKGSFEW